MSDNNNPVDQLIRTLRILGFLAVMFILFVIIRGGILEHEHDSNKYERNIAYFEDFNEYFRGTVVKIKRRPPKVKDSVREVCYKIQLIESTTCYYLERKKNNEYFCVIDFPFAEVVVKDYGKVRIGDTCFFNGASDCFAIKVANQYWSVYKPKISDYELLNPPYSSIPRYTIKEFDKRLLTYPKAKMVGLEHIKYYWKFNCDNERKQNDSMEFEMQFFINEKKVNKTNLKTIVKEQHIQKFFYMIQIDEYKEPLDMIALEEKFKDEPLIWVEDDGLHKYFINKRINSYIDAKDYLYFVIDKYDLPEKDELSIRKINRSEKDINNEFEKKGLNVLADDDVPDIMIIPYRSSIFKHVWIVFIIFTFINVFLQWSSAAKMLKKDKELAKSFQQYAIGLLFFFNIWLLTLGIGLETGMADSVFDYMLNRGKPIVIIANIYLMIFLFISSRWIFFKNGAETLARIKKHPGGLFSPGHTPDGIKLLWSITIVAGLVFIFARLFI